MHRNWKTLIKPNNLEAVELTETYGKFVAKPLERGYGVTLGNSIRRVLLSSINGAAVVAVRFAGVDHEFSTIPGVKEDVADIILNIKQVNLRYLGEGDTTIRVNTQGPKVITAANKLKIDSTFFIPQIYETYRAFAQNGGIAVIF